MVREVPERRKFVQDCTELALKNIDHVDHPLGPMIVEVILRRVLITEKDWTKLWTQRRRSNLDLADMGRHFQHEIRDALRFFPLDVLTEENLPVVAKAVLVKYQVPQACIWPIVRPKARPAKAGRPVRAGRPAEIRAVAGA